MVRAVDSHTWSSKVMASPWRSRWARAAEAKEHGAAHQSSQAASRSSSRRLSLNWVLTHFQSKWKFTRGCQSDRNAGNWGVLADGRGPDNNGAFGALATGYGAGGHGGVFSDLWGYGCNGAVFIQVVDWDDRMID